MNTVRRLRCDRLSKKFGGVWALREVTIDFPIQGIVAVIGPNGAGKSTLINALTGFLRCDSGDAYVNGTSIGGLAPHEIARMGVSRSFQGLRLVKEVSVIDNCLLAGMSARSLQGIWSSSQQRRVALDRAREVLSKVCLLEMSAHAAGALSYGQQKLLSLACCIMNEPSIFLLDEPIAGVHPEVAQRVLEILRNLADSGRVVVFIEHDLASVRELAQTVVVLDEGRVIAEGPPSVVFARVDIMEAYLD